MEKQWNERKYILNKQTNRPMMKRYCASFILGEQPSNDSLLPLPSCPYNVCTESYGPRKNNLIFTCSSLWVVVYLKMGFSKWNSLKTSKAVSKGQKSGCLIQVTSVFGSKEKKQWEIWFIGTLILMFVSRKPHPQKHKWCHSFACFVLCMQKNFNCLCLYTIALYDHLLLFVFCDIDYCGIEQIAGWLLF